MTDLSRRLDDLGPWLEFPATPDLAASVIPRLRRRRRVRRGLAVALAALALGGAILAASPGARSAVADWLGIGGVRVVEVDDLPVAPVRDEPFLGRRVTLAEARRRVDFPILLPDGQRPDAVYVRSIPSGGAVTLVYGSPRRPRLLLSQWVGATYEPVLLKTLGPRTDYESVDVEGGRGLWISGSPHAVFSIGRDGDEIEETLYLAGNVLVWERGRRSFRLEADVGRDDAVAVARSLG